MENHCSVLVNRTMMESELRSDSDNAIKSVLTPLNVQYLRKLAMFLLPCYSKADNLTRTAEIS